MLFKGTLMLYIILFNLILFAGSFDFSNIYFIKDATVSSVKPGKFLYFKKNQEKNFGFIVNCEDFSSLDESAILKSITGFASPLIKVPVKNRVLSDAFEKTHPGVKSFSFLRLCPSSANNEIEFYKYMNSYYLKFVNNYGSETFSEILIKISSISLIKSLLGKDHISSNDYIPLDQDPLSDGNEVFELNTMSDDVVEPCIVIAPTPILDLNKIRSDSFVDAIDEKIETYINNKNKESAKLDIVAKVNLKERHSDKEASVTLDSIRDQYLFSESLLKKMGYKNDLDCHYVIPFQKHIPGNCFIDKVENISYENISILSEKDAESVLKSRLENGLPMEGEYPLSGNREFFSIVENSGNIKYSIVVSNKNKNKKFGYTINCADEKIEDKILLSFLGNATPDILKKNRMNSHEFSLKYGIDPTGFLMLCPLVDGKNKISLLYDGEVYYLRFVNNFGSIKFSDSYHKVKSIDLLKALDLSPQVATRISSKDILDKDIFELEHFPSTLPAPKINPTFDVPKPVVSLNKKSYRLHLPDSDWSGFKSAFFNDTLCKITNEGLVISETVGGKVVEKNYNSELYSFIKVIFPFEKKLIAIGLYEFWDLDIYGSKDFLHPHLDLEKGAYSDAEYASSNDGRIVIIKGKKYGWINLKRRYSDSRINWMNLPESSNSASVTHALLSYKDGFLLIQSKIYFIDRNGSYLQFSQLGDGWQTIQRAAIIEGKLHSITNEGEYKITDMETGLSEKLDISLAPWWLAKN